MTGIAPVTVLDVLVIRMTSSLCFFFVVVVFVLGIRRVADQTYIKTGETLKGNSSLY